MGRWRSRRKAPEVVEAEKVRDQQFAVADAILGEVDQIRESAKIIEDYVEADKMRIRKGKQ